MAVSSPQIQDLEYLYASNANVSNFVSVKLSGIQNYHLWKTQMFCLMETHDMCGIVDVAFDGPRASSMKIMKQYDSLLKGWIFGSVRECVLGTIVNLRSAKDVWDKLKSFYDPTMCFQQDTAQTKPEAKEETKDNDVSTEIETEVLAEIETDTKTKDKDTVLAEIETETETETKEKDAISAETETKGEYTISIETTGTDTTSTKEKDRITRNKWLRKATMEGNWSAVKAILIKHKGVEREAINSDGNTILHLAVGIGHNDFVKNLLRFIKEEEVKEVLEMRNVDGSTALHVAAIVGNEYAADLLVQKNETLLTILDNQHKDSLHIAYSNFQFDTFIYLFEAANADGKTKKAISQGPDHIKIGVNLLVNAISAKQYSTASKLVEKFPEFAVVNDEVLMAIARTFPSGLNFWETLFCPPDMGSFPNITNSFAWFAWDVVILLLGSGAIMYMFFDTPWSIFIMILVVELMLSFLLREFMNLLYFFALAPILYIKKKKKDWEEATEVLELVCDIIDKSEFSGTHHPNYNRPILEAACQNAYQVVDEILCRSPEAIRSTDKNGYDIIQLAVTHRSENIYNLIYQIGERKSRYRTIKDSSMNNILHLAGRLGPSNELNSRTGAALQLQRELQWREELKKVVFPTYITEENIFKETPDMVFTREHKNLVKEGENWMKTTAESCSITAALITTIVFAAAITVPGGSNQETGIPLFTQDIAFTIFAISDAISLFASSTSLLVFLSILTARFAEQDFLVGLPRQLIIGLCTLLLSTIAMMVAFGATLYLVFCRQKPWMLAPICGLAILPIGFFVTLQFPLIVDLLRSTYVPIFGKQSTSHYGRKLWHVISSYSCWGVISASVVWDIRYRMAMDWESRYVVAMAKGQIAILNYSDILCGVWSSKSAHCLVWEVHLFHNMFCFPCDLHYCLIARGHIVFKLVSIDKSCDLDCDLSWMGIKDWSFIVVAFIMANSGFGIALWPIYCWIDLDNLRVVNGGIRLDFY
ncbi:hypothetical protein L6452_26762 [Arctium lappa]|uniref:Uncharacterized protein n=1 Tax=Arctium lappa TaxID=4217 RepID=A0ACB8ZVB3_ARCLA|nr:hypothetical protein L6452_26762 [Arctium lappa]